MSLASLLRKVGLIRPFDEAQIADAETENAIRDHGIAIDRVETSNDGIRQSQMKLLESIQTVRASSETVAEPPDPIAQFVHDMRSSAPHRSRRN